MPELYDTAAPRKATSLSVNSDLLTKTRALNINLSATLEQALKEELGKHKAAQWANVVFGKHSIFRAFRRTHHGQTLDLDSNSCAK